MSEMPSGLATRQDPAARSGYGPLPDGRGPTVVRHCVGVVVTDAPEGLLQDPYYSTIFKGISTALAEESMLFLLMAPLSGAELHATRRLLVETQVDGLILIGLHIDSWLPKLIRRRRLPAVMCGHPPANFGISGVDCDNREGSMLAVDHLLSLGRRRIAHVSGNVDSPSGLARMLGYRDAIAAAGLPFEPTMEESGNFHVEPARLATSRLLERHPDLDAIFVASDLMAVAVMEALAEAGRRIPEDVAVIGFDDSSCAATARPSLSTISQSIEHTGSEAVRILMRQIAEPEKGPERVVLEVGLVVRESTAGVSEPTLTD
jgi:DNA-binding LacI/PurR family transcriptional regulator